MHEVSGDVREGWEVDKVDGVKMKKASRFPRGFQPWTYFKSPIRRIRSRTSCCHLGVKIIVFSICLRGVFLF